MVLSESSSNKITDIRRELIYSDNGQNYFKTMKPYSVEELECLLNVVKNKASKVNRTRLHSIFESIIMDTPLVTEHNYKIIKNRSEKEVKDALCSIEQSYQLSDSPWGHDNNDNFFTPFVDIAELIDFV